MKITHRIYISVKIRESNRLGVKIKAFNSIDGKTTLIDGIFHRIEVGYANKHYWNSSEENNAFLDFLMKTYGITFERLQRIFDRLYSGKQSYTYNYVRDLDSISKGRSYKHLDV